MPSKIDRTVAGRKARFKAKQPCKYGHPLSEANVYRAGTGRNRMCVQCREDRRRGIERVAPKSKKYYPHVRSLGCRHGHVYFDGDDLFPPNYRLSVNGRQRLCLSCEREKEAAQALDDLRWINLPPIMPAFLRSKLPSEKISPWNRQEKSEHGHGGSRRRNPWSCHFTTPFIEPPQWREILRQERPTPAEMKAKAARDRAADWYESVESETRKAKARSLKQLPFS